MNVTRRNPLQIIGQTWSSTGTNSATLYGQWFGSGTIDAALGNANKLKVYEDIELVALIIRPRNNDKGGDVNITVMDDGVATILTKTIPAGSVAVAEINSQSILVLANSDLSINMDSSGGISGNIGFLAHVYYRTR